MQTQSRSCSYRYDALDRLALRSAEQNATQRFYCTDRLATKSDGDRHYSYLQAGGRLLAQRSNTVDGIQNTLLATGSANSVLAACSDSLTRVAYSSYGHRESATLPTELPGFNGEQPDPLTGHYLLGNGYRAFNPVLMRFNSPDSLSPFGKGGLNAYAYCLGDPINRVDPTGHWGWLIGAGLMVSAVGAGAAHFATKKTNPQVSLALGVAALGLTSASVAVLGTTALTAFSKIGNRVAGRFNQGLSGKGAARNRFATTSAGPSQQVPLSPEQLAARHEEVALEQVQGQIRDLRPHQVSKYLRDNPQNEAYVKKLSPQNLQSYLKGSGDHVEWLERLNRAHTGRGRGFLVTDLSAYPAQHDVVSVLRSMGRL
ncbi:RHS repeat-associated core domain-containing protein [Pseudomonas sp. JDS28PS106]|uniref:RHS repeat-associated core domain-containing protein n=1 Tax=Pseudomonas sp. JDS28PS106 TaxID=2497235 RepID=UPI002FCF71F5